MKYRFGIILGEFEADYFSQTIWSPCGIGLVYIQTVPLSQLTSISSGSIEWRTKGQNQNKNQREGNTPPPPIAILLVFRKPKN
jgi:hypothetical protein